MYSSLCAPDFSVAEGGEFVAGAGFESVVGEGFESVVGEEFESAVEEGFEFAVEEAVELAVEAHVTAEGRLVTPAALQNVWAKVTADAWSASLHVPAKQHAIPLRNPALEQMQAASRDWQSPILPPVVN